MSDQEALREAIKNLRAWSGPITPGYAKALDLDGLEAVCAAAESTLPKSKTIEVWHVEYAVWSLGYWQPRIKEAVSLKEAQGIATGIRSLNDRTCIRVTGPFQQEVPA